jgi:D-glycero-D-manno-heptose 1,7-bisphosphate phosphatase
VTRALFLDRDGVVSQLVFYDPPGEWESARTLADLSMIEGVTEPLRRFVDAGWLVFLVTNQPSYAKRKTTMEDLLAVEASVERALGIPIVRAYVCFHHPEAIVRELRVICECRKPGTLFLREAARDFGVDFAASWMVGDQDSDLACGRAAGCRVALIENPRSADKRGTIEPDLRCRDLGELAAVLLKG